MYSYALLEPVVITWYRKRENGTYLLQVKVITDHCMYVEKYQRSCSTGMEKRKLIPF
jgi:hypothetical protein